MCMSGTEYIEEFDELYKEMYSSLHKVFPILSFSYSKKGFDVVLTSLDMEKVTKADIVVFNGKSKQYRIFKYVSGDNNTGMVFKCEDVALTIRKQEFLWSQLPLS